MRHGARVDVRDERYCGTPAGWANYAGHLAVRDLILTGPIDLFEAIDRDLPDRIPEILSRDPDALDRPFSAYVTETGWPEPWRPRPWYSPLAWAVVTNKADAGQTSI